MKANLLRNISYALVLLLTFSSCSKDYERIKDPIEEETPVTIYISGYSNEIANMGEVVWKNGKPIQVYKTGVLPSGYVRYGGIIYDFDIENDNVYAVWKLSHKKLSAYFPSAHIYLWKNNENTLLLQNDYNIYPKAVDKHGDDLYFAGDYTTPQSYPSIWKNGNREQLPGGIGSVSDLLVTNTDVLAVGYVVTGSQYAAAFWKNGVLTKLNEGFSYTANSIAQAGYDTYIAGSGKAGVNDPLLALIWKNGIQQTLLLPAGQIGASSNSVAIGGNKVYVVGYSYTADNDSEKAVLWIDGSPLILSSTKSIAYSVVVKGNTIYACGYEKSSTKQRAVMWKIKDGNIETTKLSNGTEDAVATCIKVK
ncbi:MAG: hypothetical protein K1X26_05145 [Chitinophagales bacterium]|nr:hypothetical protein [Chitinophagales bacterium]MCB9074463.1 hypothetical protein [Chitinophagales bacterium]HMY43106.1 hypothetical protein [Chitinophagales bacterium]HMZ93998.1 hypothetical protein [Chitinophagales bacterium]HNC64763.1 hypothetical protein [Chitinophagales bacterium]